MSALAAHSTDTWLLSLGARTPDALSHEDALAALDADRDMATTHHGWGRYWRFRRGRPASRKSTWWIGG